MVSTNPDLAEPISKMLLERFITFYVPDENIQPPIELKKCITFQAAEVITQEPIGDMIYSLQKMYISTASKNSQVVERLSVILESLCKRMAQLELEHLEMVIRRY